MESPAKRRWFTPFNRRVVTVSSILMFTIGAIMKREIATGSIVVADIGLLVVAPIGEMVYIFSVIWLGFEGVKCQTGQDPLPPKGLVIFDIMLLLGGVILLCLY